MNPPDVPLRFDVGDPNVLRRDLERTTQGLVNWARELPDPANTVPRVTPIRSSLLAFEQLTRVAPADGEVVELVLPPLDRAQGGKAIRVARMNLLGMVFLNTQGSARIDGVTRALLYNSVGVTTIWYDGAVDYLSDGTTVDLGAGL